jgi:hypothetical protein
MFNINMEMVNLTEEMADKIAGKVDRLSREAVVWDPLTITVFAASALAMALVVYTIGTGIVKVRSEAYAAMLRKGEGAERSCP